MTPPTDPVATYAAWIEAFDRLDDADRAAIAKSIDAMEFTPVFSVVMPVFNPPEAFLREAIASVRNQLYPFWELCIADDASSLPHVRAVLNEAAAQDARIKITYRPRNGHISAASNDALALCRGRYVTFLDHDDSLAPHALYMFAQRLQEAPEAQLLFCDEDKIDAQGQRDMPYFKLRWNIDLLRSQNCMCHMTVLPLELVRRLGDLRLGTEGSQDHDLVLRVLEEISPDHVQHIPHVLYHWRAEEGSTALRGDAKTYAWQNGVQVVNDHLQRQGIEATAALGKYPGSYQVTYRAPAHTTVSILLDDAPTHPISLAACERWARFASTHPQPIQVVITASKNTQALLRRHGLDQDLCVLPRPDGATWASAHNLGAESATGDVLVTVANDAQWLQDSWVQELTGHAMRPEVGTVGAQVLYSDGLVHHAGLVLGLGGLVGSSYHLRQGTQLGYRGLCQVTQQCTAVWGTCMATRRALWQALGGFDSLYGDHFADVDYGLRARASGHVNIYTPFACVSVERAPMCDLAPGRNSAVRFLQRYRALVRRDPYYSPNLNRRQNHIGFNFPPEVRYPWRKAGSGADVASASGVPQSAQ